MTNEEKLEKVKLHLDKYPDSLCGHDLIGDMAWLINRVKVLTEYIKTHEDLLVLGPVSEEDYNDILNATGDRNDK